MSCLLVVQPDSVQARALSESLRPHISEDVVVAASLDDALTSIDQGVPDVILLPPLIPAAVEDYLITYLSTIPGAGHVQILSLPHVERADMAVPRRARSLFPWRRGDGPRAVGAPGCVPNTFTQDVLAYLASAKALKEEIAPSLALAASGRGRERRREPRLGNDELPWVPFVSFGGERAALINVSSGGMLLRTRSRPQPQYLRRFDPNLRGPSLLTLELGEGNEIDVVGRVIRCVPLKTGAGTQYEIAFSFDDSVGLHLPAADALVPVSATGHA